MRKIMDPHTRYGLVGEKKTDITEMLNLMK
jgi:hypothetical protein